VNKQSDLSATRNVLALVSSANLKHWKVNTIVLRHRDRHHHAWHGHIGERHQGVR